MLQTISNSWNDHLWRLAFFCILFMGAATASISPYQSVIGIERLGFSNSAYALITMTGSAFSVATSVLVGVYCDQTGRYREVLLGSLLLGLWGGAAMFFMPSKASFVFVHVVLFPMGFTAFTQFFALAKLASSRNPDLNADFSSSAIRAAFAGSYALTPPIWAILVANGVSLLTVYAFAAAVYAAMFVIVFVAWPKNQDAHEDEKSGITLLQSLRELSAFPVLSRMVLIALMISANNLYAILLGLLVLNNLGGTEADVGWFAGGVALAEVPVMLLGPAILRYMSKSAFILLGMFVYASFLSVLGTLPSIDLVWWLIIPAGIGAGILLSVTVGYIQDLKSDRPGAGGALVSVSHFSAVILASAIFAIASTFTDYVGVAICGAIISLSAGIALFALDGGRIKSRRLLAMQIERTSLSD